MNKLAHALESNIADLTYRILSASDAPAYQDLRTEALTGPDHRFFTTDIEKELGRTTQEWEAVCSETCNRVAVGAFRNGVLVGAMLAERYEKDPSGQTIYYGSEYVRPLFRNMGVAKGLLNIRDEWAAKHGFNKAVFTIRYDNPWLKKQVAHGAKVKKFLKLRFADGVHAPVFLLERNLHAGHAMGLLKADQLMHEKALTIIAPPSRLPYSTPLPLGTQGRPSCVNV